MKKRLALLLTTAMIMGSMGGGMPVSAEEHEPVTLRLLTRWTGSDPMTKIFGEIKEGFVKKYPWITIQDDSVNEESAYLNILNTSIATGDMPNVFYVPTVMGCLEYAKSGIILDVSEMLEDEEWAGGFNEGVFDAFDYSSFGIEGTYAVPFSLGIEGVYYNKAIFEKAGIEKVPETMDEMYDVIEKLKAIGVVPFAVGADETWRAGHVLNWQTYKTAGVKHTMDIGARTASWTDPEMVESLQNYMNLKEAGAFPENYEGLTYQEEQSMFFQGDAAMVLNGTWFIGDCNASEISEDIGMFAPPYYADKEEFKTDGIVYPQAFCLDGTAEGAEKEAEILFVKYMTSALWQEKMANEIEIIPVRHDIDTSGIDSDSLFYQAMDIAGGMQLYAGDTTDYEPIAAMLDVVRNTLIGMSLGQMTPEEAAQAIQTEIEMNS